MEQDNAPGTCSHYSGPVKVAEFQFSTCAVRVVQPAEPDRLLDAADVLAWNQRDDYMPYWAYLWPGAFLLAEHIAAESWTAGQQAIEIGCGLGLAGLVGLSRGLRVRFTDYDEAPLRFVEESARANGFDPAAFTSCRLDWRGPLTEQFPIILAADVLYERRLVPLVANVIARMLEPGGVALVADPYRVAAEGFDDVVRSLGLACETRNVVVERSEFGNLRGALRRIRHATV